MGCGEVTVTYSCGVSTDSTWLLPCGGSLYYERPQVKFVLTLVRSQLLFALDTRLFTCSLSTRLPSFRSATVRQSAELSHIDLNKTIVFIIVYL